MTTPEPQDLSIDDLNEGICKLSEALRQVRKLLERGDPAAQTLGRSKLAESTSNLMGQLDKELVAFRAELETRATT